MAISIDWPTKVISVPKTDMTLVDSGPPEVRELDVDWFRKQLNALQAGDEGISFDTTHIHYAPVVVGGVSLARVVEIINGYTVTFEDLSYIVNLTGANNNVSDVTNLNLVSVRSANSGGLVETGTSGLTATEAANLQWLVNLLEGDVELTANDQIVYLKGTLTELIRKSVSGSQIAGTITLTEP